MSSPGLDLRAPGVLVGLVLLAVAALAGFAPAAPALATGDGPVPTMTISPGSVEPGGSVLVSVAGWPAGSAVARACGDRAERGDDDCDGDRAATIDIGADGSGSVSLIVTPPVSCPCVVRVSEPDHDLTQALPVELLGAGPTGTASVPATAVAATPATPAHHPSPGEWALIASGLGVAAGLIIWRVSSSAGRTASDQASDPAAGPSVKPG